MFPAGLPGLALLLLRAAVCIGLHLSSHIGPMSQASSMERIGESARFLVCTALLLGLASPVAAALTLLASVWSVFASAGVHGTAILTALDAIALCLLGPGAYSIDSRLFGRRLLVIPPRN